MTLSEIFADFIWSLSFEKIPSSIVEKMKWCALDSLANIIGSQQMMLGKRMIDFVEAMGESPEVTIVGTSLKTSRVLAAFANGSLFSTLGTGDGYNAGRNHPGGTVWPVAYSLLTKKPCTGKEFLTAAVAGYETTCRIAAGLDPSLTLKGFNPTGTIGTIGAAATAAKMLGLTKMETVNTIGISGYLMPLMPFETIKSGYTIMPLNCGHAAQVGLHAAFLAQKGFTGDPYIMEGRNQDGICYLLSDSVDLKKIRLKLGAHYNCTEVYLKPYPSVRPSHGPAEGLISIRKENPDLKIGDIVKVIVWTYKSALQFIRPTDVDFSSYACRMNLPFTLAVALADCELGPRQFEEKKTKNPSLHELAKKIEIREKDEYSKAYPALSPCEVEIHTVQGKVYRHSLIAAKGDQANPFSPEEVISKFDSLTGPILHEDKRRYIKEFILNVEKVPNMCEFWDKKD